MSENEINVENNAENEEINENVDEILHKFKNQQIAKGWNEKNEKLLITIGQNCSTYQFLHESSYNYYNNINNILKIILIITSSVLSVIVSIYEDCTTFTIIVIRHIFVYLVNILTISLHFLQLQKLAIQHSHVANKYSTIYHDIQQQMCLYRRDRILAVSYVSMILKRYDNIKSSAPSINLKIIDTFKKRFGKTVSDSNIPDIIGKIKKIDIIKENNESQLKPNHSDTHISSISNIVIHDVIPNDINDIELGACKDITQLRKIFSVENYDYEYQRHRLNESDLY